TMPTTYATARLHHPHHLRPGSTIPTSYGPGSTIPTTSGPAPSAVGTPSGQCMFAQMAPTATGVASEPARPDITQVGPQQQQQQQQQQQACACELAEFVACALGDLKLCEDPERRSKGACLLMVSETRPGFV
uniref:Uncharacterized protein n=1 Tax=Oreochromis aureus TaxID=47969 RepID=A0AAZ1XZN1_OREAU